MSKYGNEQPTTTDNPHYKLPAKYSLAKTPKKLRMFWCCKDPSHEAETGQIMIFENHNYAFLHQAETKHEIGLVNVEFDEADKKDGVMPI